MSAAAALEGFAAEVGTDGAVRVVGGRTQWDVGGPPSGEARELEAPTGVVDIAPDEMTVRVRAGTPLATLEAELREVGQRVALHGDLGATVGGVLAVGRSGVRRLGDGPVRDALLEARVVTAEGRLVTAGGPTVKNVSGFDLPRLLVGSLGTLALIAEVILRTRPIPVATVWRSGEIDPFVLLDSMYRPTSVLWDGRTTWACLEGEDDDVAEQILVAASLGLHRDSAGPPPLPAGRRSVAPSRLRELARPSPPVLAVKPGASRPGTTARTEWGAAARHLGDFVAEVGVGIVHGNLGDETAPAHDPPAEPLRRLHDRLKASFDPSGRLNPGRSPLRAR
ncbi:MAG TPA: FAD-binding protein [Microthrixaceae bacterium]|nr:FAD-binding protein [Microthrixaceae bacterium]